MHTSQSRSTLALVLSLALPLGSVAAESSHPCAQVRDDSDRLACYDATFGKPARSATPVADASEVPARPVPAPVATPLLSVAPEKSVAKAEKEAAGPAIGAATVTQVQRRVDGRLVVTLDNAQTWVQLERDAAIEVAVGDKITVRSAMFGSYILVTKSGLQTRVQLR
jgi:hypothetical protein